ncbi:MAG: hypothetical protein PHF79_00170 [Candidatus Pacebacteria bacterium]|nr:hypothetical protein [Candidatus Paceibacterota bacterium]
MEKNSNGSDPVIEALRRRHASVLVEISIEEKKHAGRIRRLEKVLSHFSSCAHEQIEASGGPGEDLVKQFQFFYGFDQKKEEAVAALKEKIASKPGQLVLVVAIESLSLDLGSGEYQTCERPQVEYYLGQLTGKPSIHPPSLQGGSIVFPTEGFFLKNREFRHGNIGEGPGTTNWVSMFVYRPWISSTNEPYSLEVLVFIGDDILEAGKHIPCEFVWGDIVGIVEKQWPGQLKFE